MLIALLVPMVNSPPGIQDMPDAARGVTFPEDAGGAAATDSVCVTERIVTAATPTTARVAANPAITVRGEKRRAVEGGLECDPATRRWRFI
jgi:hypothetical protein